MWPSSSDPQGGPDDRRHSDAPSERGPEVGSDDGLAQVLTLSLQLVFVSREAEGLRIDCLVADRAAVGYGRTISAGAPFSLVIGSADHGDDLDRAHELIDRWCRDGEAVEVTTRSTGRSLWLRVGLDELVLDVA